MVTVEVKQLHERSLNSLWEACGRYKAPVFPVDQVVVDASRLSHDSSLPVGDKQQRMVELSCGPFIDNSHMFQMILHQPIPIIRGFTQNFLDQQIWKAVIEHVLIWGWVPYYTPAVNISR